MLYIKYAFIREEVQCHWFINITYLITASDTTQVGYLNNITKSIQLAYYIFIYTPDSPF